MSALVKKLSEQEHRVLVSVGDDNTPQQLKQAIDRGYVHITFPTTQGGTELFVPLNMASTDIAHADFEKGQGEVKLVGYLTLDFVPVECVAQICLETMDGRGRLNERPSIE